MAVGQPADAPEAGARRAPASVWSGVGQTRERFRPVTAL
jgi:hypothetical protein